MLPCEVDILNLNSHCRELLQAYREHGLAEKSDRVKTRKAATKAQAADSESEAVDQADVAHGQEPTASETSDSSGVPFERSDPWISRVSDVKDVEAEEVSSMHGRLIAAGFLNFQIQNRHAGLEYRVSNLGKQYLSKPAPAEDEEDDLDHPDEPDVIADTAFVERQTDAELTSDLDE